MNKKPLYLLLLLPLITACLWDYDTLEMERRRFPSALETITGKFLSHSKEFYYWRIVNRERRVKEQTSNFSLYDDLAVSYSKLGQEAKALQLAQAQLEQAPNRYESLANAGTFLLHLGRLEEGIPYIRKAIEVNPNAHFGREKYQLLLAEYILSLNPDGKAKLPLNSQFPQYPYQRQPHSGFLAYLQRRGAIPSKQAADFEARVGEAIRGILGMMRFGNNNSPILNEALGDLLLSSYRLEVSANQLACRAYLKASYALANVQLEAAKAYRLKAQNCLVSQFNQQGGYQLSLDELEALFQAELADAQLFREAIRTQEQQWIREKKDLDVAFRAKYYSEPESRWQKQQSRPKSPNMQPLPQPPTAKASYQQWMMLEKQKATQLDSSLVLLIDSHEKANIKKNNMPIPGNEPDNTDPFFIVYLMIGLMMALLLILKMRRVRMNRLDQQR